MPAKIMIVEDEEALSELLHYNLVKEGYCVERFFRGDDADMRLRETVPDLLLLDWMLPGLSGILLCSQLRMRCETKNLPIIMLTARGEESEKIRGISTGADDYMVKPFSVPELLARIKAILRRTNPEMAVNMLNVGDIELNRHTHRIFRNHRELKLGPTDYKLLEFLLSSPGRVFTREQLLNRVWGNNVYVDERTVDVHIARLRKAMVRGNESDPIRTVRGVGYALDKP